MFFNFNIKSSLYKAILFLLLGTFCVYPLNAQCPQSSEVFDYIVPSFTWSSFNLSFCENEGIVDLTNYLNPAYPIGEFNFVDPFITEALLTSTILDVSLLPWGFPFFNEITYEVTINENQCEYNFEILVIPESPELDPNSIANINNVSYNETDENILIQPIVTDIDWGVSLIYVNGSLLNSPIYNPGNSGNAIDTILVVYGAGCIAIDTFFVDIISLNLSTFDTEKMNFYPNPVENHLMISFENTTKELVEIKVFNQSGQQIIEKKFYDKDEIRINQLENLAEGIYFTSIQIGDKAHSFKFFKN